MARVVIVFIAYSIVGVKEYHKSTVFHCCQDIAHILVIQSIAGTGSSQDNAANIR